MTDTQKIALAEFNIALDAIDRKLTAVENGASFGPWDYSTREQAQAAHASIVKWEFDAQKTYNGLRSHWNHPNRWLGKNAHDWTVAIVPHADGPARCYNSEVRA